jgi:Cytochrome c554 and c-prime
MTSWRIARISCGLPKRSIGPQEIPADAPAYRNDRLTIRKTRIRVLLLSAVLCRSLFAAPQPVPQSADNTLSTHPNISESTLKESVGDRACQQCHQEEFETFSQTRHHLTSQLPERHTIAGKFTAGENTLTTFNPEVSFRMDERNGHFYETAILAKPGHKVTRTEQIGIVIGSGRKGQTYLYWKEDRLYELPVSYWTELDTWVNSPGYVDGSADFDRAITPRCLECHASFFQTLGAAASGNHFSRVNFVLGISCERCHGPGSEHVRRHQTAPERPGKEKPMAPVALKRERQVEVCAQCHGGVGDLVAPAFSFRPGEQLSFYIKLQPPDPYARIDVHGNQVALLEKSRCFQSSTDMTCSTCHDVHVAERPAPSYSDRCITCHQPEKCPSFAKNNRQTAPNCIDCHMPVQASNSLVLDFNDTRVKARVRNHWIRVYPAK